LKRAGKKPEWPRWAWLKITASISSISRPVISNLGKEYSVFLAAMLTPQSIKILLSWVVSKTDERPTSENPPRVIKLASAISFNLDLKIFSPTSL
jgi:hypothetical protein